MRIAPVLLPHLREPTPALGADAGLAGAVTHNDRASIASCVSFVELLWSFLGGGRSGEPWLERFIATFREVEGDWGRYATRAASVRWDGSMWRYIEEEPRSEETAGRSVADACDRWYSGA